MRNCRGRKWQFTPQGQMRVSTWKFSGCISPPRPAVGECSRREVNSSLTFPYTSLVWGCPKREQIWPDHKHVQHHLYLFWWASSHSSSLPTLWLWNSRDPIAHSDLQPATCCPWCSLYLQPSLGTWLYQKICRTFSLFRLLLLFLTGSSQCGSTLVFSDLRLNFLMTALTSCLVLCDTKCLGALETCCANTSAACSRFTGFLVVLHSTEVKLW